MLAENYNWFTEGFDTANLKDAEARLDRLDSEPDAARRFACSLRTAAVLHSHGLEDTKALLDQLNTL